MNKLEEIFDATIEHLKEVNDKVNKLSDRLDKLEKDPKVVNNYYTQNPPITYPQYPHYPVWTQINDGTYGKMEAKGVK